MNPGLLLYLLWAYFIASSFQPGINPGLLLYFLLFLLFLARNETVCNRPSSKQGIYIYSIIFPGSSMLLSPLLEVEITRDSTAICMASGVVRWLVVAAEPAACACSWKITWGEVWQRPIRGSPSPAEPARGELTVAADASRSFHTMQTKSVTVQNRKNSDGQLVLTG